MGSFRWNPLLKPSMDDAVNEGLTAFLLITSGAVREQLSKGGTGRLYRRSQRAQPKGAVRSALRLWERAKALGRRAGRKPNARTAGWHRASASGNPPAADTGLLRRSWQVGSSGRDQRGNGKPTVKRYRSGNRIGLLYGSPVRYARIESGYGRVRPRPYIKPTMNLIRDLFAPTMQRAMKRWSGGSR